MDESGNSGPNLLDEAQPTYVIGGWACDPKKLSGCEQAVSDFSNRLRSSAKELKGAEILGGTRIQHEPAPFLKALGAAGTFPFFAIFEKRYWIAGKVINQLCDPVHNRAADPLFFASLKSQREAANRIAGFSDNYLREFAKAAKDKDHDDLLAGCGKT